MNNNAKIYGSIFIIAFLAGAFFIAIDPGGREIKGDAIIYYRIADNILNGHGFSDAKESPYKPTMSREPIYPFLISFLFFLFKKSVLSVQITQAVLYALMCLVVFRIYRMCFDEKIAFAGAIFFVFFPTIPSYVPYLFTELLFAFLLALTVLAFMEAFKYNKLRNFFYAGIGMGVATLCKAVLMFFFIFAAMAIFLYYREKSKKILSFRAVWAVLILLSGYSSVVAPWVLRNEVIFGKPAITLRGYSTMYTRAVKVNLSRKELKMYAIYCFSEHLASRVYPGNDFSSTGKGYFYQPVSSNNREFAALGLSSEEADNKFKEETLFLIQRHPIKFINMGFFELIKFNSFAQVLLLNDKKLEKYFHSSHFLSAIRGFLKALGIIMAIISFCVIASIRRYNYSWLPAICVILYFNSVHFFLDSVPRYALPIIPYYILFLIQPAKVIYDRFILTSNTAVRADV